MGGVFNTVNFHVYHYGGNNPVKYTDPDGEAVITLGFSGRATSKLGLGAGGGFGIGIGFSKAYGVSFGFYGSAEVNYGTPTFGGGVTASFTANAESVRDLNGSSTSINISASKFELGIATDGDGGLDPASGVSFSVQARGYGLHYVETGTITVSTSTAEIAQGVVEVLEEIKGMVFEKLILGIP